MSAPVPDPFFLASFLACAFFLLAIGEKVKNVFGKPESQKRDVTVSQEFVAKPDFEKHAAYDHVEHGILHKRINDAEADYNEKFQQLPNQIVMLLRNTGVIQDRRLDK